ncbi:hypothetical protein GGI03_000663 [Coemansia sp. RSA 2337]|nr:hypothetical protein H4S04_001116 [Coemansia sp. S16]KAJ2068190.1 hypothetical protein GGI08_001005 [Coemansia sp. S2]KAJ2072400.1 hypothetical protein GGH13_002717 [Coemansia sp. S155-1]KAJ2350600.1 hypothetical protein GGH92_002292 [Coemansia sp. RSA 2673]KAJ2428111.1 hypothetical protein GGF41_001472 [Coemansia sp. RSA 2531]KAJ2468974.1 hypothetical protein GGI03_000663 [Coemansia sp. RSA 2337]
MCTLSLFQILPSHIVELIVGHVAGSSRLLFDTETESPDAYAVLLIPLMSVCRDFRAAVLTRYCRIHKLDLSCFSDQGNDKMILWPERLRGIGFSTHLYARELDITFGTFSVYNGTALKELLREPYSDILFPMVRSLKVTLIRTTKEQRRLASIPAAQDIEPNIGAFVQRIRLMAPTTRKVCISLQSRSDNESQFAVRHFNSLVAQLGQLGNTIEHNYNCRPMRLEPPLTGICSLVHMEDNQVNGNLLMQLARYNAPTLQTLKIYVGETESTSHLIQNVDGSYVQFPYLTLLRLEWWLGWERGETVQQTPPVFPSATPFPNLRHLTFKGSYPFGDDTPFRGNADTLEYLSMALYPLVIGILKERQVFTHDSHPKLQCVSLMLFQTRTRSMLDTDVPYMQIALGIGPNACVRHFAHDIDSSEHQFVIPSLDGYTCIQVLSLSCTSMDLWDVMALVKALPNLTDLHTIFAKPGTWPSGISDQNLPAYVIANYPRMGGRFRCWRSELYDADVKVAVKCMLLLALVCPNFDYAAVSSGDRELFMAHMKKIISSNGYRQHATRLRRLLFGGWRNEIPSVRTLRPYY